MWQALVQGVIQGLTEFLPVSSSGHLVLAQQLFGMQELDPAFNVFVQGGTVISLFIYYFPRIRNLQITKNYLYLLVIATIPAAIAGVLLEDTIDAMFSSMQGLGWGFVMTTVFILLTYRKVEVRSLNPLRSSIIGIAQALAILPSLSRSGATIGTAIALGIEPKSAFDFSFLLSIPVMVGATLLSARHINWSPTMTLVYLLGFGVAAIVGYVSLILLAKIMKKGKFYLFAPYTLALALISFYLAN